MASAQATEFARNIFNVRGSEGNPAYVETVIKNLLTEHEDDNRINSIEIIAGQGLLERNMNLIHAVGKSAVEQPRMIIIDYRGNPDSHETELALVGKGVTYDTGGLNLKPTGSMETMYMDKGGACAVIGALHGCLNLKPKKNIIFTVGLAENAIDAKSYKPGDIIKSMKGLTVEIGNTDAEGRLVLADCFTYV